METAGIDFGSTLVKAYWQKYDRHQFVTVDSEATQEALIRMMKDDGVRTVRCTGIGKVSDDFEDHFDLRRGDPDAVDDEIRLQALGTRTLMARGEHGVPRKMVVAAVGTGVSYTIVKGRKAVRHKIGGCHGGGTLMGIGRIVGAKSFKELEDAAAFGKPPDLRVQDKVPATAGAFLGDLVIAHFWKQDASFQDNCAGVFSLVVCSIMKDIAILTSLPFVPKDVAVVGTLSESRLFRHYLLRWAPLLKGRLHFPKHGAYAAAVGAWADISKSRRL